jgi:hypothetical protein
MCKLSCNKCHNFSNGWCSKSTVQKLGFLCGSIATNDKANLLTIESKWLEAIVHMTKSEFLDLPPPKQVLTPHFNSSLVALYIVLHKV